MRRCPVRANRRTQAEKELPSPVAFHNAFNLASLRTRSRGISSLGRSIPRIGVSSRTAPPSGAAHQLRNFRTVENTRFAETVAPRSAIFRTNAATSARVIVSIRRRPQAGRMSASICCAPEFAVVALFDTTCSSGNRSSRFPTSRLVSCTRALAALAFARVDASPHQSPKIGASRGHRRARKHQVPRW